MILVRMFGPLYWRAGYRMSPASRRASRASRSARPASVGIRCSPCIRSTGDSLFNRKSGRRDKNRAFTRPTQHLGCPITRALEFRLGDPDNRTVGVQRLMQVRAKALAPLDTEPDIAVDHDDVRLARQHGQHRHDQWQFTAIELARLIVGGRSATVREFTDCCARLPSGGHHTRGRRRLVSIRGVDNGDHVSALPPRPLQSRPASRD